MNHYLIEKLQGFKKSIQQLQSLSEDAKRIISIKLYDFIQENELLKVAFNQRVQYFDKLIKSKSFLAVQDGLIDTISKIVKLTTPEDIKAWRNGELAQRTFLNHLKQEDHSDEYTMIDLVQLWELAQSKENYYLLGDSSGGYSHDREVSLYTRTDCLKSQYQMIENELINRINANSELQGKNPSKQYLEAYDKLAKQYNDLLYKFNEMVIEKPVKLNIFSYEKFWDFCTTVREIKGHEVNYQFENYMTIERIKEVCIIVIDDLLDCLQLQQVQDVKQHDSMNSFYSLNELEIDMQNRLVRNTKNDKQMHLSKTHFRFLEILINEGRLVSYEEIAGYLRDKECTVDRIDDKQVMDRKNNLLRALKTKIKITKKTSDQLISGKNGYQISRKIYE